jgi:hypothetical protein
MEILEDSAKEDSLFDQKSKSSGRPCAYLEVDPLALAKIIRETVIQ